MKKGFMAYMLNVKASNVFGAGRRPLTLCAAALVAAALAGCAASKSSVPGSAKTEADGNNLTAGSDISGYIDAELALAAESKPKPGISGARTILPDYRGLTKDDSIADAQYREEEGQDFNSLFDNMDDDGFMAVDTLFAWSNSKINSGRFDFKALGPEDTIRVPLVDKSIGKVYAHPHAGYVTSPFGTRRFLWHYGMDVKLNKGDTVRCAFDGIVRVIQYDRRGYGNVVVVRHHSGLETVYGHLYKVTVGSNQRIKAGESVGLGGNTGRSSGAHLHFEIRYFGEPFDPRHIIDFDSHALKSDTLVLTRDDFEYLTEARRTVVHTVRRGDNLGSIARRYGTSVNKLCQLNGIRSNTILSIGRRIVVRSGKDAEKQVIGNTAQNSGDASAEDEEMTEGIASAPSESAPSEGSGIGSVSAE